MLAVLALGAAYASSASAEALVNGDFETGNLDGWKAESATGEGDWFAIEAPEELDPPFNGRFVAVSAEEGSDRMTLSQEVALAPLERHVFTGTFGYSSDAALVTPDP